MRKYGYWLLFFFPAALYAQCPTVDFTTATPLCLGSNLGVSSELTDAISYSWDFCDGSLLNTPVAGVDFSGTLVSGAFDLDVVEENGSYYMFSVGIESNNVVRYSFGTNLSVTPTADNLGNLSVISQPLGIALWQESNNYFGLVTTAGGNVYLLTFGNSTSNTPTASQIPGLSLGNHRHLKVVQEGSSVVALLAGGNNNSVSVLDFGSSITNTPVHTSIAVPGSSFVNGLDTFKDCTGSYAVASGLSSNTMHVLSFGSSYLNTPTVSQLTTPLSTPLGLSISKQSDEFQVFVSTNGEGLVRLDFGTDLSNLSPAKTVVGTLGRMDFAIGFTLLEQGSSYHAAAINYAGRLSVFSFPKDCDSTNSFSDTSSPDVSYLTAGTYTVTLKATGSNGEFVSVSREVTVQDLSVPTLVVDQTGVCEDVPVVLHATDLLGSTLTNIVWTFSDATEITGQDAERTFTDAGEYAVTLEAETTEGCAGTVETSIMIYVPPTAGFTLPTGLVCTNNEFTFNNSTTDEYDGQLSYEWYVDEEEVSTDRDLQYAFTSGGDHSIRLKTILPGCFDEITQPVLDVGEGPSVDFEIVGICEDVLSEFENGSVGSIAGYHWNLDEGDESTDTSPEKIFDTPGSYTITLLAEGTNGCVSELSKAHTVYSRPAPDFTTDLTAFSCSGTPTQFHDLTPVLTDSNVDGWAWDFDDDGLTSDAQSPQHLYAQSGAYNVTLTVESDMGCSNSIVKEITVSFKLEFTTAPIICLNSDVGLVGSFTDVSSYEWDFCDGSLLNVPAAGVDFSGTSISGAFALDVVEDNGSYYLFSVGIESNNVTRYAFGSDLTLPPIATDFGNLGGLSEPLGIGHWEESGNHYALVTTNGGAVYLLSFGSSLGNTPSASQVSGLSLGNHRHIKILSEEGTVIGLIAGGSTNSLSVLNFGSSITNPPSLTTSPVSSSSFLTGLDYFKDCTGSYVVTSGLNSGLHVLSFGSSFLNTPTSVQVSTSVTSPYGLTIGKQSGLFHVLASSGEGIVRLDFGSDLTNIIPSKTVLGTLGRLDTSIGFTVFSEAGTYHAAAINYTGRLSVFTFPKPCATTDTYANVANPPIQYSSAGSYAVTLKGFGNGGEFVSVTKTVTVLDKTAPNLSFTQSVVCEDVEVVFHVTDLQGSELSSIEWTFTDATVLTGQDATRTFTSSGLYTGTLSAETVDGCAGNRSVSVPIYSPPAASFALPSGQLCTNNAFDFVNTTTGDYDGHLTYEWYVDDNLASDSRDLQYAFTLSGDHSIRLKTILPGCFDEITQPVLGVGEGPSVDFEIVGLCEDVSIEFENESVGSIAGYHWDLGEGDESTDTSPGKIFDTPGTYTITLLAEGMNGCVSEASRAHMVYSRPAPDFNTDLPPFSCSGTPTQFHDLTPILADSNIETWSWDFADSGVGSASPSPQHTYAQSGEYNVALTVASDRGCLNTTTKAITISASPTPAINNTPACVDAGVVLTDASGVQASAWQWQVGTAFYFTENPSHVFALPGDYSINLILTAENGCLGSTSKSLNVPEPLTPDFSSTKKCVGEEAILTASVTGTESVTSYLWDIESDLYTGQSIAYEFNEEGLQEVLLTVVSETGCEYSVTKALTVVPAPIADFTINTSFGPPPLAAQFTNQSMFATQYLWHFNDATNTTSSAVSPPFTFTEVGSYAVDLTAMNDEGCENTISRLVQVAFPVISISLTNFQVIENANGTRSMLVTLQNNGNVMLSNAQLKLQLGEAASFSETVTTGLAAGQSNVYQLSTTLNSSTAAQWICVSLQIDGNAQEQTPLCELLEDETTFITPMPNPASDEITLQWISRSENTAYIEMVNNVGTIVANLEVPAFEGFNTYKIGVDSLQPGMYFLRISSGNVLYTFRTIIAR